MVAFGKSQEQKMADAEAKAEADATKAEGRARADAMMAEEQARADAIKAEERARDDAARAHKAFLATPAGQAAAAREQGQGFFEIQLDVGSSQRDSTIWGGNNTAIQRTKSRSHAGTLAAIEAVGWKLEHVGYIFIITGESSRDKFLASGQQTAVSGKTVGIYLFRNVDIDPAASRQDGVGQIVPA